MTSPTIRDVLNVFVWIGEHSDHLDVVVARGVPGESLIVPPINNGGLDLDVAVDCVHFRDAVQVEADAYFGLPILRQAHWIVIVEEIFLEFLIPSLRSCHQSSS